MNSRRIRQSFPHHDVLRMSSALRCSALPAIAVRHAFCVEQLDFARWRRRMECQGKRAARRREGLKWRTVFAAPGHKSVASRRYEPLPIRASGGIPAEAGKRHQIALHFIPDMDGCFDTSGKSRALHGHHVRVIHMPGRVINRRAPRRGSHPRVARAPRRRHCSSTALPKATRPFVSA
jgi:hypothetical protein